LALTLKLVEQGFAGDRIWNGFEEMDNGFLAVFPTPALEVRSWGL
jgi:hypothetical protein